MSTPFLDLIQELRKLAGAPKISYPFDDVAFPVTERTMKVRRGTELPAFLSAEPDTARFSTLVLTQQVVLPGDAQEVEVYRKYEIIPGKFVATTRVDDDGKVVTVNRRRNLVSAITSGETLSGGVWTKTTMENSDSLIADEVVETRVIPGNGMTSTRLDEDGGVVQIVRTKFALSSITSSEVVSGSSWIKTTAEAISDLVGWKVFEIRAIPGTTITGTRIDEDGITVFTGKIKTALASITSSESIGGGFWTKVYADPITELVGWQVTEVRAVPGNPMYSEELAEDSMVVTVVKTKKDQSTITPGESSSGGFLVKTTQEAISDLVAWEKVETRALPGNILTDYDQEPETQALIVTTYQIVANPVSAPSASPGYIIKVKHIDNYNSWLITEGRSTPSGWTEQDNGAFQFPTLFDYLGYSYTDGCGAFADNRDGFSCNVKVIKDITFGSYDPFTGLQLIPKTLQLGKNVSFNGILVDAGSFVYTGSCTGTVSFGASSPDYSTYIGTIAGTVQLIGGSSKKTKYGDFRTERLSVLML